MKRKSRGQYSYDFGNNYPPPRSSINVENGAGDASVPKFMGWRWDELSFGSAHKKWFPGKINKTVRCLMKYLLNPFPVDTIPLTRRDKNGKIMKICPDSQRFPKLIQKPTLKIEKRDGEIGITLNPLKPNDKLATDCNPYLDCSPLTFKIRKHPEEIKRHQARKLLQSRGFTKKCCCLNIESCRCISPNDKKLLSYAMEKVSKEMKLKNNLTYAEFYESSDSESDIEFTTPAAAIAPSKCKPDVIHEGTQYAIKDFIPKYKEEKLENTEKKALSTISKAPLKPPRKLPQKTATRQKL
jgi:hypothetical protein